MAAALAAGALYPLGFAPFGVWPVAIGSVGILFFVWHAIGTPGRAALAGFLFGVGAFGVGVSWVYVSLHHFGGMAPWLAALMTALFVAVLAGIVAAAGALAGWIGRRGSPLWRLAVVFPSLFALSDWVRGWFLTGFPWLSLGYSQSDTWLAGFAPWVGVYGVGLAAAMVAGLLVTVWSVPRRALASLTAASLVVGLGWIAGQRRFSEPSGTPIRVSLIQGNVPIARKWQPENRAAILDTYRALSAQAAPSDLIVWPEAAVPGFLDELPPDKVASLREIARAKGATLLFGVLERSKTGGGRYYNTVWSLSDTEDVYRKRHLVPFGEFLPFRFLTEWFVTVADIPMSDFTAGADRRWDRAEGRAPGMARSRISTAILSANGRRYGISICFEDAFGEEVIQALPEAEVLVNVSEDGWFGDSLAAPQRLQMARFRSMETERPMLRAANTGPSAMIDHRGRVTASTPQFKTARLEGTIQPMRGATPYVRLGNGPAVILPLVLIAGAFAWRPR